MLTKRTLNLKNALFIVVFAASLAIALNQLIDITHLARLSVRYSSVSAAQQQRSTLETVIFACLLIPIMEEIVFRGFIFKRMRLKAGFYISALVSAALFGAYHMNLVQFVYAFVMGFVMCMVFECYGGIAASIIFHMAANSAVFIAGFIDVLGVDPWRMVSCAVALLCSLCIIFFIYKSEGCDSEQI